MGASAVTQEAGVDTVVDGYNWILDQVVHLAALSSLKDTGDVYYMPLKRENQDQVRLY